MIKLSTIKSNPNNPRVCKDDKFAKLVNSIKEFPKMMELRPMVVNSDMVVLGGNMRLKALKEAGYKEVPDEWVKSAESLTEEEQRRFIIADNVGFGEHDWDMLANEWDAVELEAWGLDIPSFETDEVLEAEEDDFDATPPAEPITVLGDLYEIGEHRLLCGDSTDSDQVAKLMNGSKADMVFTDPPYGMNLNTNYADIHKNHIGEAKNQNKIIGDDKDFNFLDFYALFEYVKEQFWWGADYYKNEIPKEGCFLVWDKTLGEHKERIGNEFEICWSKQTHKKIIDRIKWVGFVGIKKDDGKRQHPSQKPIELCCRYLNDYSKEKNIIIDLFLGSGSTMVASHQLKRKCYGMELDPKYCDVIVKRMIKLDPTLIIKRNGVVTKDFE
jgi:DNA modification methylase